MRLISPKSPIFQVYLWTVGFGIGLWACAGQERRLGDLSQLTLQDVIHDSPLEKIIEVGSGRPEVDLDPSLDAYLQEFEDDAVRILTDHGTKSELEAELRDFYKKQRANIVVFKYVSELTRTSGKNVAASCNTIVVKETRLLDGKRVDGDSWKEIEVHEEKSKSFTGGEELKLKKLLYHEIFHCIYDKGHLPKYDDNGEQIYGIMSEKLLQNKKLDWQIWEGMLIDMFVTYFHMTPDI